MIITTSTPQCKDDLMALLDEVTQGYEGISNNFLNDINMENYRVVVELKNSPYLPHHDYSRVSLRRGNQGAYITMVYDGVAPNMAAGPVSYNYDSDTLIIPLNDLPLLPEDIIKVNEMFVKIEDYYGKTINELTRGLWDYLTYWPMLWD